jgi:hypothetical protein
MQPCSVEHDVCVQGPCWRLGYVTCRPLKTRFWTSKWKHRVIEWRQDWRRNIGATGESRPVRGDLPLQTPQRYLHADFHLYFILSPFFTQILRHSHFHVSCARMSRNEQIIGKECSLTCFMFNPWQKGATFYVMVTFTLIIVGRIFCLNKVGASIQ